MAEGDSIDSLRPLEGIRIVTLGVNVPAPVAASRLAAYGAHVTKVEPPSGDPLKGMSAAWYEALLTGQEVITLDLKSGEGRGELETLLRGADLLLTSSRPAALVRLGLDPETVRARYPQLSYLAIVGYHPPHENKAGHDLTYAAHLGFLTPPTLPRTLLTDLACAERAVSTAFALLFRRDGGHYAKVSLTEAAAGFAAPLEYGLTASGGFLGGGNPHYTLYPTRDGWVAFAALEAHFLERFKSLLRLEVTDADTLRRTFLCRSAPEWEVWAEEHDLPIAAVR